jgi:hypothetical protein
VKTIVLFGPSGSGKSQVAEWLNREWNFLHISFDRWDDTGVDAKIISDEWSTFSQTGNVIPLANKLKDTIEANNSGGVVITCPSGWLFDSSKVEIGQKSSIYSIILYGPKDKIWSAYAQREDDAGRIPDKVKWERNNTKYEVFGSPEYSNIRIETFDGSDRRKKEELIVDIEKKISD